MKRLPQDEIRKLRESYYEDALYVTLSDAIDEVETRIGGLTPEEVWTEVIRIKDILVATKRPDKTIQNVRTELEYEYQYFSYDGEEGAEQRLPVAAEWTCVVVLTCVMFYLCTPREMPGQNMKIALKIRKLIWDHPAYAMLRNFQRPAEKTEEDDGNPVPDEDRLHPLISHSENPELTAMRQHLMPVISFYATTLSSGNAVAPDYSVMVDAQNRHEQIWMTLLQNEPILRALNVDTLGKSGIKAYNDPVLQKTVGRCYNLKLILNIIGVMKEEGVIVLSNENISRLFFTVARTSYLSAENLRRYGSKHSAMTAETHRCVTAIIRKYKNPVNTFFSEQEK